MEMQQLIVRFARDWSERSYPCLGQLCLFGVIDSLLEGYDFKRPVMFVPAFATAAGQFKIGQLLYSKGDTRERLDALMEWDAPPFWASPQAGWRTARCLQAALQTERAAAEGVTHLLGLLVREVDDWVAAMEAAVKADIRFQLGCDTCSDPPEALLTFTRMQFRKTAAWLDEALGAIDLNDRDEKS